MPEKKPKKVVPFEPVYDATRRTFKTRAFKDDCSLLVDTFVLARCEEILAQDDLGPDDFGWRWAAEYVSKYSKSQAPALSKTELTTPEPLTIRVVKE